MALKRSIRFLVFPLVLSACYSLKPASPLSRSVAAAPDAPPDNQCLVLDGSRTDEPFNLTGKLAVSYSNASIPEDDGHLQEMGMIDLADPRRKIEPITKNRLHEAEVDLSPDGKLMLYTTRRQRDDFNGPSEIRLRKTDGSEDPKREPQPLVRESGAFQLGGPIWMYPRGESFIYGKWPKNGDAGPFSGSLRLYQYDLAGKKTTEVFKDLTRSGEVGDPEPSYDGKMMTFKMAVKGDRNEQPSIYVINMDGTGLKRLTGVDRNRQFSDHDPVFSRDGKTVYFERYHGDGDWFGSDDNRWSIVAVNVETGAEKAIVPYDPCARHIFWLPTVSPDGKSIIYIRNDTQAWKEKTVWTDLWVTDLEGKNHRKIKGSDYVYWVDWTP